MLANGCIMLAKFKLVISLKCLDLEQARHFLTEHNVRLDLVQNCLKRLSADDNVM